MNTSTSAAVAPAGGLRRTRSRPRGRALPGGWLGALAAGLAAGLLAGCGSGSGPSASSLLNETFSSPKSISSGLLDVRFALSGRAGAGTQAAPGSFSLHLAGPFQRTGPGRFPQFALALALETSGRTLSVGAVSIAGRLYLELDGAAFLAPAAAERALEQGYAQGAGGSSPGSRNSSFAALGIDPAAWLTHASRSGSAQIAGSDTLHVLAGLDAARFLADAERLSRAGGALAAGQGAGLLTPARAKALSDSIRSARVDIYTGARDHVLRRLALSAAVSTTPAARAVLGGLVEGTLTFVLQFARLGRPQAIAAPVNPQPLSRLGPALERVGLARGLRGGA
ncbi:MAG TPA: hypothetical protein VGW98_04485 [Solirubrobacteraceae bacterium]|jgi:hypothetical protein|nr:hypothetical protein [Solirubrobacteraceae bacterium]